VEDNYMVDNIKNKAEEIAIDFAKSIKERTDLLLKLDCDLYTNLGKDSSEEEKENVKEISKYIYTRIALIDETSGKILLKAFDT
jgi:hypothetical protein